LDLDDDRLAGPKLGRVGLADRRRGKRLPVESVEDLLGRGMQLGFGTGAPDPRLGDGRFCSSASSSASANRDRLASLI
jgi:hypothetical protein